MKKTKKLFIVVIVTAVSVYALLCLFKYTRKPKKGSLFESYIFQGSNVTIKIEARHEEALLLWLPGAYYDYYCKGNGSDIWQPIFTFYFDSAMKIPKEQIKEINEKVSYIFIGWMYSVTTDAGKTWCTWNGNPERAQYTGSGYGFIDDIRMNANGLGVMSIRDLQGDLTELHTKDFGKTWEKLKLDNELSSSEYR